MTKETLEGFLRVRPGFFAGIYRDGLVPGATLLALMADCASEIGVRLNGSEGYLARWEGVDFLTPVYAEDWLEIRARLTKTGHRSLTMFCDVHLVIQGPRPDSPRSRVLDEPVTVAQGTLIGVRRDSRSEN